MVACHAVAEPHGEAVACSLALNISYPVYSTAPSEEDAKANDGASIFKCSVCIVFFFNVSSKKVLLLPVSQLPLE